MSLGQPVNGRYVLKAGVTYTARVTIQNTSVQNGNPVAATLTYSR